MSDDATLAAVSDLIERADAAFSAGNADRYGALYADDAQLLLLHSEAVEGRTAIIESWRRAFQRLDTSDWEARIQRVEIHDDRAYAIATYTERLVIREDGSRRLVRGRLAYWFRRDADGEWRIALLMNSHSHPMEPIP